MFHLFLSGKLKTRALTGNEGGCLRYEGKGDDGRSPAVAWEDDYFRAMWWDGWKAPNGHFNWMAFHLK